jgi:hypothetical protein
MSTFERTGCCSACGLEYILSGASLAPGAETEAPARFFCSCGGYVRAFLPGSVNRERVTVVPKEAGPA